MKAATIVGILLILLGIVSLATQGIDFRTRDRERVVDIGPLKVDAMVERERTLPLPRVLGFAALASGVVLVIVGARRKA